MKTKRIKALPCRAARKITGYFIPAKDVPALIEQICGDYDEQYWDHNVPRDKAMAYALKRTGITGPAKVKAKR